MLDKVQKIDSYATMAISSLLLLVCCAVSLYQGGGFGLAFLACHCGIFILDGYVFGQNRRIKGTFIGTVFFPDLARNEGTRSQWLLIWVLHIYVAIILLDFNTTQFLSIYVLSPAYNAFLPLYKYIPIIDSLDEVYRSDGRISEASVVSSIIVGCVAGTLIGGCFIARDINKTFFSLPSIKMVANSTAIPMMKKVSFLDFLAKIALLLLFIFVLLIITYILMFSQFLFFKTAVFPDYIGKGFSRLKYIVIGRGVASEAYLFSYAWVLPLNLLVLIPVLLRVMAAKAYVTWHLGNS